MDWVKNRTVLVTGASSGIGRELTVQLIKEYDCNVIGIGRSEEKLENLKAELTYLEDKFTYYTFDVSDENEWVILAQEFEAAHTGIDIIINNAGMMPVINKAVNYSEEQVRECFAVNFDSIRYSTKYMLPILRRSSMPGILNISSIDAFFPIIGTSIYAASKAAVKSYSEALITELGREMYIGYVCPGVIKTDLYRNQFPKHDKRWRKHKGTSVEKAAKKILKRLNRGKARTLIGKDASFMNFLSKFFPVSGIKLMEIIIKKSKLKMFDSVR